MGVLGLEQEGFFRLGTETIYPTIFQINIDYLPHRRVRNIELTLYVPQSHFLHHRLVNDIYALLVRHFFVLVCKNTVDIDVGSTALIDVGWAAGIDLAVLLICGRLLTGAQIWLALNITLQKVISCSVDPELVLVELDIDTWQHLAVAFYDFDKGDCMVSSKYDLDLLGSNN